MIRLFVNMLCGWQKGIRYMLSTCQFCQFSDNVLQKLLSLYTRLTVFEPDGNFSLYGLITSEKGWAHYLKMEGILTLMTCLMFACSRKAQTIAPFCQPHDDMPSNVQSAWNRHPPFVFVSKWALVVMNITSALFGTHTRRPYFQGLCRDSLFSLRKCLMECSC